MIGGLDLIIINAIKKLAADPAQVFVVILPVGIVLERYFDSKMKARSKK